MILSLTIIFATSLTENPPTRYVLLPVSHMRRPKQTARAYLQMQFDLKFALTRYRWKNSTDLQAKRLIFFLRLSVPLCGFKFLNCAEILSM